MYSGTDARGWGWGWGGPLPDTEEVSIGAGVGDNHVAEEPIQSFDLTSGYPLLDTG